jgi:hypothetical protein
MGGVMRALLASGAVALGVTACASPGTPPGGPPDKLAPQLVSVRPDTNSLNVRARSVLFQFDEVVNERSTPTGSGGASAGSGSFGNNSSSTASTLATLVLVSPGDGRERVTWRRHAIEVEPRNGFRPNTTYRVTILPGLGDLRGNILREPVEVVFSTGATATTSKISGIVFDWVGNKLAPNARIEVFSPADSTVRWSTRADSTGRFAVRDLAAGTYRLRAWLDDNANRSIDPREIYDSTTVSVDTTLALELYAFAHDTIGPRIETVEQIDSTGLRVKFDRGVDVNWTPDTLSAVLLRSDSSYVQVGLMMPAARYDSLARAALEAADTTEAKPDSVARAAAGTDTAAAQEAARAAARAAAARTATADSLKALAPKLNRPIPIQWWVVKYGTPIAPGDYRIRMRAIRGLTGATRDSEREFRLRPPAVPRDSTTARPPATPASPDGRPGTTRPPAARAPERRAPETRAPESRRPRS